MQGTHTHTHAHTHAHSARAHTHTHTPHTPHIHNLLQVQCKMFLTCTFCISQSHTWCSARFQLAQMLVPSPSQSLTVSYEQSFAWSHWSSHRPNTWSRDTHWPFAQNSLPLTEGVWRHITYVQWYSLRHNYEYKYSECCQQLAAHPHLPACSHNN